MTKIKHRFDLFWQNHKFSDDSHPVTYREQRTAKLNVTVLGVFHMMGVFHIMGVFHMSQEGWTIRTGKAI